MAALLRKRWVQLAAVSVVAAFLLGFASAVLFTAGVSGPTFGPVTLTTGGTVFLAGDRAYAAGQIVDEALPLTGAQAVAVGWKDPILCSPGRGRYFQKTGGGEAPYLLMYDSADDLMGIYHISTTEMPPPWEFTKEIFGGAGPVIDYEHWGLFVYFRDSTQACTITQATRAYR